MYRTPCEVWFGLAKNAGEALADEPMIGPMTLILLGGQVLPLVLLILALAAWPGPWPAWQLALVLFATAAAYYPRLAAACRFRQSLLGAVLHHVGVLLLLAIQWFAFLQTPWVALPPGKEDPIPLQEPRRRCSPPANSSLRRDAEPTEWNPAG